MNDMTLFTSLPRNSPRPGTPENPKAFTIALFADVNPNLIDGSTIWLQSIALCCLKIPNSRVILILRERLANDVVMGAVVKAGGEIRSIGAILEHDPRRPQPASPSDLVAAVKSLDAQCGIDLLIVRGENYLVSLAKSPEIRSRLWGYWLRRPDIVAPWRDEEFLDVADSIDRVIVQSDSVKSTLESICQIPATKILSMPPMVPSIAWQIRPQKSEQINLVYSGKMDKLYSVEAFFGLPALLALHQLNGVVTFIGDKFNAMKEDPGFVARMQEGLTRKPGVLWHKGVEREQALALMSQGTFGLCWRSQAYDSSLEISTKLLEFCALGVPPLANRTDAHLALLGNDYPYFVSNLAEVVEAVRRAQEFPETYQAVSKKIQNIALKYSFDNASLRFQEEISLSRSEHGPSLRTRPAPKRVLIAGHDNKFLMGALERLQRNPDLEIRFDQWRSARKHLEWESVDHVEWADIIFCEWCAGAAIWYSKRVKEHQKCFVRLHRFEAFEGYPSQVDFGNVSRLIVVSDHFRDICVSKFGVDAAKIDVLPQYVDWRELNRPKHPWADHTLGLVGINGFFHKRFDRAIDILVALRANDPRWRLRIRSVMPWEISWVWQRSNEAMEFARQFRRITEDPDLRDNILFDSVGVDMTEWYRQVGFILSTSDSEGCHTSVAEGMASGTIPVIYNWPGAGSVYPPEFVFDSTEAMVQYLRGFEAVNEWQSERQRISELARVYDVETTCRHLESLFLTP